MDKSSLGQHISKQFNNELEEIRSRVLTMGGMVEVQLSHAIESLLHTNKDLAEQVVENDMKVNGMEVSIDEECTTVLARRQPAAGDLRLMIAVIKTITDLERIGDEAKHIARQALSVADEVQPLAAQLSAVEQLGNRVKDMLHRALDAFARMDVELSIDVSRQDMGVDMEYEKVIRHQITYMMEDPRKIPTSLDVLWASRALERVGDRCCNICEYVIYLVEGKDVRHISIDEMENQLR